MILETCTSMTPQGIVITDKYIYISAYCYTHNHNSVIYQLDKDTLEIIQVFDGVKDAEKALGVSHGWLSKAARQDKIAYGYKWKFI